MPITNGNQLFLGVVGAMNQRAAQAAQERQAAAQNKIAQQQIQLQQQQLAQAILQMKQAKEAQDALNQYRMDSLKLQQENFKLHEEQWRATDQMRQVELQQKQMQLDAFQQQATKAQQLPNVLAEVMSGVGNIAQAQLGGDQEKVKQAMGSFSALFERPEIAQLTDQILPFATKAYGAFNIDTGTQNILLQSQLKAAQVGMAVPEDIKVEDVKALDANFESLMKAYGTVKTRDGAFSSPADVDKVYEDKTKKILEEFKPTSQTITMLAQMQAFKPAELAELTAAWEQNNPAGATTAVGKLIAGLKKKTETEALTPERRAQLEQVAVSLADTQREIARINRTHAATRKLVESVGVDLYSDLRNNYHKSRAGLAPNPIERAAFATESRIRDTVGPLQTLMAVDEVQQAFADYVNTAAPDNVAVERLDASLREYAPPSLKANPGKLHTLRTLLLRAHAEKPIRNPDAPQTPAEREEERLSIADLKEQMKNA